MEGKKKVDWKSFDWKSRRDRCGGEIRGTEMIRLKGAPTRISDGG